MPYLQPATNNYFGLMPVINGAAQTQINAYPVSSSEGNIFPGDIVVLTSINTVRSISTGSAAGAANVVGVAAQFFAANAGSTTMTNLNKCLIYDAPEQLYFATDSSSGRVGSSGIGLSYFVLATGPAGTSPSTTLFRSNMAISGGVQASSAGNVKIIALHPIENNVYATGATGAANCRKWIVALRAHTYQVATQVDLLTS